MLAGTGFSNQPRLAHADCQQALADAIVDLVRAGMEQVLALQINLCAAEVFCKPLGIVERRGAPGVVPQEPLEFRLERGIVFGFLVCALKLLDGMHESFRHIAPAKISKASANVGPCCCLLRVRHFVHFHSNPDELATVVRFLNRSEERTKQFRVLFSRR